MPEVYQQLLPKIIEHFDGVELATVPPPKDEAQADATEWMRLGTFAVSTSEDEGEPTRFIQLAVSREGIVSGTFFNTQTDVAQAVLGQVDSQPQRVAMRLGEDDSIIAETGLYNPTLDEAPELDLMHIRTTAQSTRPTGRSTPIST